MRNKQTEIRCKINQTMSDRFLLIYRIFVSIIETIIFWRQNITIRVHWGDDTVSKFSLTVMRRVKRIGVYGSCNRQFDLPSQLTTDLLRHFHECLVEQASIFYLDVFPKKTTIPNTGTTLLEDSWRRKGNIEWIGLLVVRF